MDGRVAGAGVVAQPAAVMSTVTTSAAIRVQRIATPRVNRGSVRDRSRPCGSARDFLQGYNRLYACSPPRHIMSAASSGVLIDEPAIASTLGRFRTADAARVRD